jgi:phage terminase small subunit
MTALINHRHELFAQGLVEGKTADQAYTDAGYKPGRNNAARLRANENIQARIKELQKQGLKRHDITVDRVLEEYAKIGFCDIRKAFDDEGNFLKPGDLDTFTAGAVASIKKLPNGDVEFRLADKKGALDSMGKHLNMFKEDNTFKTEVIHNTISDLELARRFAFLIAKGAHEVR